MTHPKNPTIRQGQGFPQSRRDFLKSLLAAGVVATLPNGLLRPVRSRAEEIVCEGGYEVFRNACPRNCYDTCSIKTFVKDGVIHFIEGAPESTFTRGGLCVKGYGYTRRPYGAPRYNPVRKQAEKCSFCWQRIDAGLKPQCVLSCPVDALQLIDLATFRKPGAVQYPPGFPRYPKLNPSVRFFAPRLPRVVGPESTTGKENA
jgi:ferredoxin